MPIGSDRVLTQPDRHTPGIPDGGHHPFKIFPETLLARPTRRACLDMTAILIDVPVLSYAHERAEPFRPLRLQNDVRSRSEAQHGRTSTVFKIRIELPSAALHHDRGNLILPSGCDLIEPGLVVTRFECRSRQVRVRIDCDQAGLDRANQTRWGHNTLARTHRNRAGTHRNWDRDVTDAADASVTVADTTDAALDAADAALLTADAAFLTADAALLAANISSLAARAPDIPSLTAEASLAEASLAAL